jgi:hypothetical protein
MLIGTRLVACVKLGAVPNSFYHVKKYLANSSTFK